MNFRFRLLVSACVLVLVAGMISAFAVDGNQEVASDAGPIAEGDIEVAADGSTVTTASDGDKADRGDEAPGGNEKPDGDDSAPNSDSTALEEPASDDTAGTQAPTSTTTTWPDRVTTTAAPTTTVPLGTTPTTPGTYTYNVSGTVDGKPVSGTSELTVPEADGRGVQAQVQSGPEGSSTTTYRFTPKGTYLESMSMSAQGQTMTLSATKPFLVIPTGATLGTTSSGRLKGSGLTANVEFTLVEVGPDVAVAHIDATVSGSVAGLCRVNGTMDSTITARRSDQLPLETTSATDIATCALAPDIRSNTTTTLRG